MKPSSIKLLSILLIACAGLIAYANSFHCAFQFDDQPSITGNLLIRNIHRLQDIWSYWPCRFLSYLSLALNYRLNGLDVTGYHIFNLSVHLMSALLVWWLVLLTLSTPVMKKDPSAGHALLMALTAGLVFVTHPIQTQAVTYIVQRAAAMATMFYLASLCLYVKSRLSRDRGPLQKTYYTAALITAIAAMFSKEIAITLPLMLVLYEFYLLRTGKNLDWKYLSPFLLTLLIIPATILLAKPLNTQGGVGEGGANISALQYLLTEFRVIVTYIRLAFLPLNQNLDYDYRISHSLFEWPVLISLVFLAAVLFFAKKLFSKHRLLSFSILWFFLTLMPESSFLPIKDVIYEHRLYLPLVGFSLFLAGGMSRLFGRNTVVLLITLSVVTGFNSFLTCQRNKIWLNDFTLWDDTVKKSPHKARPYNNRGYASGEQGRFTQAMSDFDKAIDLDPDYAEVYKNRGVIEEKQNDLGPALSDFSRAIALRPRFAEAYTNRGAIYAGQNNLGPALADFSKVIALMPEDAQAYYNRGIIESKQNALGPAQSDFSIAVALNPRYADAYHNRGVIEAIQNDFARAMADFSRAIELNPQNAQAYYYRGIIFAKQNNLTQAISDYNKAIEINPRYTQAYNDRLTALKQASGIKRQEK